MFTRRNGLAVLVASALLAAVVQGASAQHFAYAETARGDFGVLNLDTGYYASVGNTGVVSIVGMGLIGGVLYAVDNNPADSTLYTIDTGTGAATIVAPLSSAATGGTTAAGLIYLTDQNTPSVLHAYSTVGASVGGNTNPTFATDGLLALDISESHLYLSGASGSSDELYNIDIGGTVRDSGPLNERSVTGLIFGTTLYSIDGGNINRYTVSPSSVSGLGTTVITGAGSAISAVAVAPNQVPEPASALIIGIGAVGLAIRCHRFRSRSR